MEWIDSLLKMWRDDKLAFLGLVLMGVPGILLCGIVLLKAILMEYFSIEIFNDLMTSKIVFTIFLIMGIGMILTYSSLSLFRVKPVQIQFEVQQSRSTLTHETQPREESVPTVIINSPVRENIQKIKQDFINLNQIPIISSEDTIFRSISEKLEAFKNQERWRTYFPISISLFATLIVVKFDDTWTKFYLTGSQWYAVFVVVLAFIVAYMSYLRFVSFVNIVTINDIIDEIRNKSL